jgi:periplasmic divalent cation tolerance protein
MSDVVLIYTTWPDVMSAETAARDLVEAKLAACANVLAPIGSVYHWQGKVERARETPVLFKTTAAQAEALAARIAAAHPYDTPAVVSWPVSEAGSNPRFLSWVRDNVAAPPASASPQDAGTGDA